MVAPPISVDYSYAANTYGLEGIKAGYDRVWFRGDLERKFSANLDRVCDENQPGLISLLGVARQVIGKGLRRGHDDWSYQWSRRVTQEAWERTLAELGPDVSDFVQYQNVGH